LKARSGIGTYREHGHTLGRATHLFFCGTPGDLQACLCLLWLLSMQKVMFMGIIRLIRYGGTIVKGLDLSKGRRGNGFQADCAVR